MSKQVKLAKATNDKTYPVEVKYTDADDKEQVVTIEAGSELEVPEAALESVTQQIVDAVEPAAEETEDEKKAREDQEAADQKAADDKAAADAKAAEDAKGGEGQETAEQQLAKANAKIAEMEAEKAYAGLLAKGKILPAQKELFMSIASLAPVTLSADISTMKLSKGQTTSAITLLSAILEAGPVAVKTGEKGKDQGAVTGELSKDQEEKLTKMGFNIETFKKQLAKGTISLTDIEE